MKELKKILQTYSSNYVMLGNENNSDEIQNVKIEELRISLEKLIKKEYKRIFVILFVYITVIITVAIGFFFYYKNILNNLATLLTITGLSPFSLIGLVKNMKQKINSSIILELATNLNKESLSSVLNVFGSMFK